MDDTLPEAHLSLAAFLLVHDRNWVGAEKEIKRVLALNPKLAAIHHLYSFYFLTMGRDDHAIAKGRRASGWLVGYPYLWITSGSPVNRPRPVVDV